MCLAFTYLEQHFNYRSKNTTVCIVKSICCTYFLGAGRHIQREDGSEDLLIVNIHQILQFATGAEVLPPMGFDRDPEIQFTGEPHQKEMRLPSASTCGPTLYLPLVLSDPDVFSEKMDMAIIGGQCFGAT